MAVKLKHLAAFYGLHQKNEKAQLNYNASVPDSVKLVPISLVYNH